MKQASLLPAIAVLALATVLLLVLLGSPASRSARPGVAPTSAPAPESSVNANGFTLTSARIALPEAHARFPDGPGADVVNANCTACHSADMALAQPPLTADQWKATVTKMREVYKAPVADADMPAILAYLAAMPGQRTESVPAASAGR